MYSLMVGLLGCVFLAISVFAITGDADLKDYVISIPIGIVGIVFWILAYFIYVKTKG